MEGKEQIGQILSESLPRELLLSFERFYPGALEKAIAIGKSSDPGHRASVVGHNRHFALNEALMHAIDECGIERNPLRGNAILVGKVGVASVARVHMNHGKWDNSRRSKAKVKLCEPNRSVAALVQVDWLRPATTDVQAITVFLVTEGDGTESSPGQVYLAVPDDNMDLRNPVFVEPLSTFIGRYQLSQDVADRASPTLKAGIKRKEEPDES